MTTIYAISRATSFKTQQHILGCESCDKYAGLPLSYLLGQVTGYDPSDSRYVLSQPLKCPRCAAPIIEETFVDWE
jgi:hypothetical protein